MAQRRPNNAANNDEANKHYKSEDDAGIRWGAVTASGQMRTVHASCLQEVTLAVHHLYHNHK